MRKRGAGVSQLFEMRLTKEQAEWVIYMEEIQEDIRQEINDLQRLSLNLANYIGDTRSDIALLTGKALIPFQEDNKHDDFMIQLVKRLNGRGVV